MSLARMHALVIICLAASWCPATELVWAATQVHAPAIRIDRAIADSDAMPRLYSLLASRHGELLVERYFNGREYGDLANVKSVSKSILSALVGIAIEQDILDGVGATLDHYFSELPAGHTGSAKRKITLEDLLTMRSGLRTTSNGDYGEWVLSDNWIETTLAQPLEAQPGREMRYSTGNSHLLSAALTRASGRGVSCMLDARLR